MISSAARSASVTGDLSRLDSTSKPRRTISTIASPASRAASAISSSSFSSSKLSGRHSYAAVEPDGFGVHVGGFDHETDEPGVFLGLSEPLGERHLRSQRLL